MPKPNCKYNKIAKQQLRYFWLNYCNERLITFDDNVSRLLVNKNMYKLYQTGLGTQRNIIEVEITEFAKNVMRENLLNSILPDRIE